MDAQVFLKENAAKAVEVARAVETTAGALADALEKKSGVLAEVFEKKTGMLSEVLEKQGDALVGVIGSKAAPIAKAVEKQADLLGGAVEEKLERARQDALESLKGFKFGQREAILLGFAAGALAMVVIVRRMDRQAAAQRLRAAGTRAGESAQKLGAKVSPAVATLTSKAGELAGQVKDEVTTRAGELAGQLRPSNGRHGEGDEQPTEYALPTPAEETRSQDLDEARQRLSAESTEPAEAVAPESTENETASPAATAAPQEAPETSEQPRGQGEIKVSNGMKVVAFDGTDIGRVQEVREEMFVLDRPRGADLLVPLDQIARIEGTVVYLRIEVGQVTKMGWEKGDPK